MKSPHSSADRARATELVGTFQQLFGVEPSGVWRAPGRVNLIGEHLDYNNGLVLPFAIDRSAMVAVRLLAPGEHSQLVSTWIDPTTGRQARTGFDPLNLRPGAVTGWASGPAGVAWALQESTGVQVPGFQMVLDSIVPVGSGLSSSHAVEVSVALALAELTDAPVDRRDLARITQRAENDFVGAPTGIMDQSASLLSTAGHAVLLNCRTLETEHIPLPLDEARLRLLVVDTRVAHSNDDGGYAARRATCEQAAELLGVDTLGDLPLDADLSELPAEILPKARHVLSERARVDAAVEHLRAGRWQELGSELSASHASLRDDYQVSCPELDVAVEAMTQAGALGARMTGAGFGGSAIGLLRESDVTAAQDAVLASFQAAGWDEPRLFTVLPGEGADRLL
ncbi:galactokinase [Kocuria sp. ZOR0020]|uniref:galactokinase n=1 Tax=Kocuria sp. ZOR0020 TaxID=1339234 RepID=UPI000B148D3D|nr:galactokinase [Kocuria sp. ZOR0020]